MIHFLHFFYWGRPWYAGNVWGNVFVVAVLAPAGWLWSKTRFWPLRPLHRKLEHLHARMDELHARHDAHHEHLERIAARVEALHAKLDGEPEE